MIGHRFGPLRPARTVNTRRVRHLIGRMARDRGSGSRPQTDVYFPPSCRRESDIPHTAARAAAVRPSRSPTASRAAIGAAYRPRDSSQQQFQGGPARRRELSHQYSIPFTVTSGNLEERNDECRNPKVERMTNYKGPGTTVQRIQATRSLVVRQRTTQPLVVGKGLKVDWGDERAWRPVLRCCFE